MPAQVWTPLFLAESMLGRILRTPYYWIFGRWPYLTKLNPRWALVQPLLQAVESAKEQGAKDVFIAGEPSRILHLTGFAGNIARMSYDDLVSGLPHKVLEQREQFDLCVLDLRPEDFARFFPITEIIRPYLRPGATIIAFCQLAGGSLGEPAETALRGANLIVTRSRSSLHASATWRDMYVAAVAKAGLFADRDAGATIIFQTQGPDDQNESEFDADDGTVDYTVACGVYLGAPVEAPVRPENRVALDLVREQDAAVILAFGQSNAANTGASHYMARHRVYSFNIFDMNCYKANDPLAGATNDGGSVWGRLGDLLIESGRYGSVLLVPIAVGGSFIMDWTPPGGYCWRRMKLALARLKRAGLAIDVLCWHQGEADANHAQTSAAEYKSRFRRLVRQIRAADVAAPIHVALASLCENDVHPYQNHEQVRLAQRQLVSAGEGIFPGPDTDLLAGDYRADGCHFSEKGLDAAAAAWLECIMKSPVAGKS